MGLLKFFVAVAVAAPAIVMTAPSVALADGEEASERQKQRRICRAVQDTGTRIRPPRRCMTQEEWDRITDTDKETLTEFQGRPNVREASPF